MFKTIQINNFRSFQAFSIESMARINIITGKNNVGKTAVLEAAFLLLGATNSELTLRLNQMRGIDTIRMSASSLWGWLFHNHAVDIPIEIIGIDETDCEHHLTIELISPTNTLQIAPEQAANPTLNQINSPAGSFSNTIVSTNINRNLKLTYINSKQQTLNTYAEIINNEIKLGQPAVLPFPNSFFLTNRVPNQENAQRFSDLKTFGQHQVIIDILKIIEPRLKDLSVSVSGGISFQADIGTKPLIPLSYMGDGVNRLLTIILAIASAKDGVVLIDEVENGFHYSVMEEIWFAIDQLARKINTQIVTTTHSWECVKAAHQSMLNNKDHYDFCLYRLEKDTNKTIKAIQYDRENLDTSFDLNWEIR